MGVTWSIQFQCKINSLHLYLANLKNVFRGVIRNPCWGFDKKGLKLRTDVDAKKVDKGTKSKYADLNK